MPKMKVVQVPKAGADFEMVEREIPQPPPGHVRIRVLACGMLPQRCVHQGRPVPGAQLSRARPATRSPA